MFDLGFKPIFTTAPADPKKISLTSKIVKIDLKITFSLFLPRLKSKFHIYYFKVKSKPPIHTVAS